MCLQPSYGLPILLLDCEAQGEPIVGLRMLHKNVHLPSRPGRPRDPGHSVIHRGPPRRRNAVPLISSMKSTAGK
jgi:hypothetical protein